MKKFLPIFLLSFGVVVPLRAEIASSGTIVSTPTEAMGSPLENTGGQVVIDSSTVWRPITEPPGEGTFVTLTRRLRSKNKLPNSADIVRQEDIHRTAAQTLGDVLIERAGLQILPVGRTGSPVLARIRGASPSETLVLVDGRPYSGFAFGATDLSEIPLESIERIEILRGGASALYGPNAMGGVINVITKRATYEGHPSSEISYQQRSYEAQVYRLNFGGRRGPVDLFFYGDRQWEHGFRGNSDARLYNIGGNIGVSLGSFGKFLFDGSNYHNDGGVPGQFSPPIPRIAFNGKMERDSVTPNARRKVDTKYFRSSYLLPLPGSSLMALRFFGSERGDTNRDPDNAQNLIRHEQSKGGEIQFNLPGNLTLGSTVLRDRLDHEDRVTPANSDIHAIQNWGTFGQWEGHWGPLTLIPGVRYDENSRAGNATNPRIQFLADALSWLRFSASAARSVRAPTLDELYSRGTIYGGNADLRAEHAWTYDAGVEFHREEGKLRLTYYRANVSDLIQPNSVTPVTYINVGTARRQGAEAEVAYTVTPSLGQSLAYTYLQNIGIPSGFNDYVALAYSPRHTVVHTTTLSSGKHWRYSATLRYLDARWSGDNETGTKLGSQLTVNAKIAYKLRQGELYLGADNLTDRHYEEIAGYPLPDTTIYFGIALHLWN